jgi:anti-sigma factor RsiW
MSFNFYHIRSDDFSSFGGSHEQAVTRENYEAFFVMYVDNELSASQRKAVEYFVQQNPDLEEELVMLQQSVLRPNEHIVFDHKERLLKNTAAQGTVNESNYEVYFVLYGDDELPAEEKTLVEQFVVKHPQYQQEFELIQQARLVPDNTITCPDKTYLFRTEEDDNRIVAFPWWRFSAAAIAILVIGSVGWYVATHNPQTPATGTVAKANIKEQKGNATTTVAATPGRNTTAVAAAGNNRPAPATKATANAVIHTGAADNNDRAVQQTAVAINNKKNISKHSNIIPAVNVQPTNEPVVIPDANKNETAFTAKPVQVAPVNTYAPPAVNNAPVAKTISSQVTQTVATLAAVETNNEYASNTSVNNSNKTPLRGLLRRVSRAVDKVTNPEENGKPGLRIANLEIALK